MLRKSPLPLPASSLAAIAIKNRLTLLTSEMRPFLLFTYDTSRPLVLDALELAIERKIITEAEVTKEILEGFLGGHGRKFYGITDSTNEKIILRKGKEVVQESIVGEGVEVIPFRRGQSTWSVEWKQ